MIQRIEITYTHTPYTQMIQRIEITYTHTPYTLMIQRIEITYTHTPYTQMSERIEITNAGWEGDTGTGVAQRLQEFKLGGPAS